MSGRRSRRGRERVDERAVEDLEGVEDVRLVTHGAEPLHERGEVGGEPRVLVPAVGTQDLGSISLPCASSSPAGQEHELRWP